MLRAICAAIFVVIAAAQANHIAVSGTIKDPSGAVVANAKIVLRLQKCKCSDCKPPDECGCCANQLTTESNGAGKYSLSAAHGSYELLVTAGDLSAQVPLDLNEGTSATFDVTLQ